MKKGSNCINCGKKLTGRQSKFCCDECKNRSLQSYKAQKERGLQKKAKLVALRGGQCSLCGYSDNIHALIFRKKVSGEHGFNIRELANYNLDEAEKTIQDYELVCKNCDSVSEDSKQQVEPKKKLLTENRFFEILKSLDIGNNSTLVLGVSGGVDSVAMLHLFANAGLGLNLIVAHMNHGVREEAKADEKFVKSLAKKYGLKFESKTIARPTAGNLEEELRIERRAFLQEMAKKYRADYIALAHNATDQAETVLFNLLRGAGPAGLGGMSMIEEKILRPLLGFSKAEVITYAEENNLKWVEDITNRDINYSRNYIRHQILPKFTTINSAWLDSVSNAAAIQRKIDIHLQKEAREFISYCSKEVKTMEKSSHQSSNDQLVVSKLKNLDLPVRFEVYATLYEKAKGNRKELGISHLNELDKLIQDSKGTEKIDLPNNVEAIRKYSLLEFRVKKEDNMVSPEPKRVRLGVNKFENWLVEAKLATDRKGSATEILVNEDLLDKLTIRTWQAGDKIEKTGLQGRKKLQDLFTDAKIDKESRKTWPIITIENEIIWVPGLAISRKIPKEKNKLLSLKIKKGSE